LSEITIHAVHERDAKNFWKSLGLKDQEKCLVCGDNVTANSFSAVAPFKGNVVVCCKKGSCFLEFGRKVKAT